MTDATVNIREAARLLGVHENTIRNWIRSGHLRAVVLPGPSGYRRVPVVEIARLIETREETQ